MDVIPSCVLSCCGDYYGDIDVRYKCAKSQVNSFTYTEDFMLYLYLLATHHNNITVVVQVLKSASY